MFTPAVFYKHYRCLDLEGHQWTFAERVQELTVAEMEQAGGVKFKTSF
jgi:hypothetical protein